MNTPPITEPPADPPPPAPASADFGPKKRSLSFGGLKPLMSRNSDGNKSDSGSITGTGSGGGKVKGFFANLTKKKNWDNSLSTGKAATSSSVDEEPPEVPDKILESPVNNPYYSKTQGPSEATYHTTKPTWFRDYAEIDILPNRKWQGNSDDH
jgi:hypothetical protein